MYTPFHFQFFFTPMYPLQFLHNYSSSELDCRNWIKTLLTQAYEGNITCTTLLHAGLVPAIISSPWSLAQHLHVKLSKHTGDCTAAGWSKSREWVIREKL